MSSNVLRSNSVAQNENPVSYGLVNARDGVNPMTSTIAVGFGARAFGKELTNMNRENVQNGIPNHDFLMGKATIKPGLSKITRSFSVNVSCDNENTKAIVFNESLKSNRENIEHPSKEALMQLPVQETTTIQEMPTEPLMNDRCAVNGQREDPEMEYCDVFDFHNPQGVAQYAKEIFKYLRTTEEIYQARAGYLTKQADVNEKMRSILVDWLIDVHNKFKLLPETLFLTVNILDRYLDCAPVTRQKLQLVGVTSMLIASKYEEIYAPEIKDFVYVTDKAYNREEILDMEGKILIALKFNLAATTSNRFLERYAKVHGIDERTFMLSKYLTELALIEYKMLKYAASNIAAAAIYLACKVLKKDCWSEVMTRNTNYAENQVRPCAKDLCVLLQNSNKCTLQAVRKKFASSKYLEISKIQLDKQ